MKTGGFLLVCFIARSFNVSDLQGRWRAYGLAIAAVIGLSIMAWATLGTRIEYADPLFGGGEVVGDYTPTPRETKNHATFIFVTLLIPALAGTHAGLGRR